MVARCIALLIGGSALLTSAATAGPISCHIGEPSYCFKYGGHLCDQWNALPDTATACEKWTSACIDCHNDIPDCLGHHRPPADSLQCSRCEANWLKCMDRIDARYWPNRTTRK